MKQLLAVLFVLAFGLTNAQSQSKCIIQLENNLCLVKEDNQYGIMLKNKYIIPSYFDTIISINSKYFIVKQHQNWGLFNASGSVLVPVAYYSVTPIFPESGIFEIAGHGTRNIALINSKFDVFHQTRVNEKWMAGNSEVSMHEYLCFLQAILKEKPKEISEEMVMPDTVCMDKKCLPALRAVINSLKSDCSKNIDFITSYNLSISVDCKYAQNQSVLSSLAYPVTCISHEQALLYIHWLANKLTAKLTKEKEPYYFVARLPHPYEWEEMAFKGLARENENLGRPDSTNSKQCASFNYKTLTEVCVNYNVKTEKSESGLSSVYAHQPDRIGNYNVFGNVAEMTSEKKLSKGGSYINYAKKINYENMTIYTRPAPWLGFRYVLEVRRIEK